MRKFLTFFYNFAIITFLLSCNNLNNQLITSRYYFVSVDSKENMSLAYSVNDENSSFVDVIGETVFSGGFNDKYLIIKQHPLNNKKITNYYIVLIYREFNYSPEKGVMGPYTLDAFNKKCKELNIEDIKFTITNSELE